jgi:hypothetical protein
MSKSDGMQIILNYRCLRCSGLMVLDYFYDAVSSWQSFITILRCVNCGNVRYLGEV